MSVTSEPDKYLDQIQKLSPNEGDLLVIYPEQMLSLEQHQRVVKSLSPFAESIGCKILVSQPGHHVALHPDPGAVLAEMRRQTKILSSMSDRFDLLIQAMAEDEPEDPDAQPRRYMDGSLCL
jgi:hypothetical protein